MLQLKFDSSRRPLRVLCLGAHCDDIEIGCGGTVLTLLKEHPNADVTWQVFSCTSQRRQEAIHAANLFLSGAAQTRVDIHSFNDGYFPYQGSEIKSQMHALAREIEPDVIFTHHKHDAHQDHRLLHELTWNVFRNHLVLQYEIPKYEGDLSTPNVYVPLEQSTCRRKIELLLQAFASQHEKYWFTEQTFLALATLRGIECRATSGLAEAFHAPKLSLSL